jgi:hypothetical protein
VTQAETVYLQAAVDGGRILPAPPRQSSLVPITSSELCFVFRNWDKNLRGVVRFWVNGQEVQAPWLSNWTENDVKGKDVKSGWEAWQRYALKRKVLKG